MPLIVAPAAVAYISLTAVDGGGGHDNALFRVLESRDRGGDTGSRVLVMMVVAMTVVASGVIGTAATMVKEAVCRVSGFGCVTLRSPGTLSRDRLGRRTGGPKQVATDEPLTIAFHLDRSTVSMNVPAKADATLHG
jgi:hypothetical protein